jgi:hypothetical protein
MCVCVCVCACESKECPVIECDMQKNIQKLNMAYKCNNLKHNRSCGLVVRVPGYRFRGLGSILGATRFSEK